MHVCSKGYEPPWPENGSDKFWLMFSTADMGIQTKESMKDIFVYSIHCVLYSLCTIAIIIFVSVKLEAELKKDF